MTAMHQTITPLRRMQPLLLNTKKKRRRKQNTHKHNHSIIFGPSGQQLLKKNKKTSTHNRRLRLQTVCLDTFSYFSCLLQRGDAQQQSWMTDVTTSDVSQLVARVRFSVPKLSNNTGANYCYLNSVVHLLAQNTHLRRTVHDVHVRLEERRRRDANVSCSQAMCLTLCPFRVLCHTLCAYAKAAGNVAPMQPLRTLMSELSSSYDEGRMNDAAEALSTILRVVDADISREIADSPTCLRLGPLDAIRNAGAARVSDGPSPTKLPILATQLAFSCAQTWTCGFTSCPHAGSAVTHQSVHYVRHVLVYPLLYKEDGARRDPPLPDMSFSDIVAARQVTDPFVCSGCGGSVESSTSWSTPSASAVVQLAWHKAKPAREDMSVLLTDVLSDVASMEDIVPHCAPSGWKDEQRTRSLWHLDSMVLLRSNHYVALIKDHESGKWFVGDDSKAPLEVGDSWPAAARFIWRSQLMPLLMRFSCHHNALSSQSSREVSRPTREFLKSEPRPKNATLDSRQRTLDCWMPKSPDAFVINVDEDSIASRKRPRDVIPIYDEPTEVLPSSVNRHIPPDGVMVRALRRNNGDTSYAAAHELERRTEQGSMVGVVSPAPKSEEMHLLVDTPRGFVQRIGAAIGSTLQRARASLSSPAAAASRAAAPRMLRPQAPLLLPLQGHTLTLLVHPSVKRQHEQFITSNGGTIGKMSDQGRVMDSYLLLDMRYLRRLAERGTLHTTRDVMNRLDTHRGSLRQSRIIEAFAHRLPTARCLLSSDEYIVAHEEVENLLHLSTRRALEGGGHPAQNLQLPGARRRGQSEIPSKNKAPRLPATLLNAPLARGLPRELRKGDGADDDVGSEEDLRSASDEDVMFYSVDGHP